MQKIIFMLTSLIFTTIQQAEGYSISTHLALTHRAVQEYQYCQKELKLKSLPANSSHLLADFNIFEDLAFWIKEFNWHFYHPTKDLGPAALGLGHASLKWRFLELENQAKNKKSFAALGGVLHYLQDVTNPAHTAPVFHILSDTFDNYSFDQAMPSFISTQECQQLLFMSQEKMSFFEILNFYTKQTLVRIETFFSYQENHIEKQIRWSHAFWNPQHSPETKKKNFGHYGIFGNSFGKEKIGTKMIGQATYSHFASQQIRSSLNATILAIIIFQHSIE